MITIGMFWKDVYSTGKWQFAPNDFRTEWVLNPYNAFRNTETGEIVIYIERGKAWHNINHTTLRKAREALDNGVVKKVTVVLAENKASNERGKIICVIDFMRVYESCISHDPNRISILGDRGRYDTQGWHFLGENGLWREKDVNFYTGENSWASMRRANGHPRMDTVHCNACDTDVPFRYGDMADKQRRVDEHNASHWL